MGKSDFCPKHNSPKVVPYPKLQTGNKYDVSFHEICDYIAVDRSRDRETENLRCLCHVLPPLTNQSHNAPHTQLPQTGSSDLAKHQPKQVPKT